MIVTRIGPAKLVRNAIQGECESRGKRRRVSPASYARKGRAFHGYSPTPAPIALAASSLLRHCRAYCSDLCSQVADWLRYFQRTRADGRWLFPDAEEAPGIRLAHIAAGGYDDRGRSLTPETRDAIIKRDNGACKKCGKPGNEIDHIAGSSADPSNLWRVAVRMDVLNEIGRDASAATVPLTGLAPI